MVYEKQSGERGAKPGSNQEKGEKERMEGYLKKELRMAVFAWDWYAYWEEKHYQRVNELMGMLESLGLGPELLEECRRDRVREEMESRPKERWYSAGNPWLEEKLKEQTEQEKEAEQDVETDQEKETEDEKESEPKEETEQSEAEGSDAKKGI